MGWRKEERNFALRHEKLNEYNGLYKFFQIRDKADS